MKRFAQKFAVLAVAVFALSAVGVASASAAEFTGEVGELTGEQTSEQVFTAASGAPAVTCKKAHTTGEIISPAAKEQEVTVNYSECTVPIPFLGTKEAVISPATYDLRAAGSVKITGSITIKVPAAGCETVVSEQEVGTVTYDNKEVGGVKEIEETSAITGIKSTGTGACPKGETGTYTGNNIVHRVGGGNLVFDA